MHQPDYLDYQGGKLAREGRWEAPVYSGLRKGKKEGCRRDETNGFYSSLQRTGKDATGKIKRTTPTLNLGEGTKGGCRRDETHGFYSSLRRTGKDATGKIKHTTPTLTLREGANGGYKEERKERMRGN